MFGHQTPGISMGVQKGTEGFIERRAAGYAVDQLEFVGVRQIGKTLQFLPGESPCIRSGMRHLDGSRFQIPGLASFAGMDIVRSGRPPWGDSGFPSPERR